MNPDSSRLKWVEPAPTHYHTHSHTHNRATTHTSFSRSRLARVASSWCILRSWSSPRYFTCTAPSRAHRARQGSEKGWGDTEGGRLKHSKKVKKTLVKARAIRRDSTPNLADAGGFEDAAAGLLVAVHLHHLPFHRGSEARGNKSESSSNKRALGSSRQENTGLGRSDGVGHRGTDGVGGSPGVREGRGAPWS